MIQFASEVADRDGAIRTNTLSAGEEFLDHSVWKKKFEARVQREYGAAATLEHLHQNGCDRHVVEDLLFNIAVEDNNTSMEIKRLDDEFRVSNFVISTALRLLAEDIKHVATNRLLLPPKALRTAEEMRKLARLLDSRSSWIRYRREVYNCGLPLFSYYVSRMTGKMMHERLDTLVRCARLQPKIKAGRLDALRVAVARYQKDNPDLWILLRRAVDVVCTSKRDFRGDDFYIWLWEHIQELPDCGHKAVVMRALDVRQTTALKSYFQKYDTPIARSHAVRMLEPDKKRRDRPFGS